MLGLNMGCIVSVSAILIDTTSQLLHSFDVRQAIWVLDVGLGLGLGLCARARVGVWHKRYGYATGLGLGFRV
jgi:hypothetical protein